MKNKQKQRFKDRIWKLESELERQQAINDKLNALVEQWVGAALGNNASALVESIMGGIKALVVPDLPPSAAPPDLFGGAEKEINFGHVPDPAWDVPQILPSEFVEMDERERLEGGGGG